MTKHNTTFLLRSLVRKPKVSFRTLGRCEKIVPKYRSFNAKYRFLNSYSGPKMFFICEGSTRYSWWGQQQRQLLDKRRHPLCRGSFSVHAQALHKTNEPQNMITDYGKMLTRVNVQPNPN